MAVGIRKKKRSPSRLTIGRVAFFALMLALFLCLASRYWLNLSSMIDRAPLRGINTSFGTIYYVEVNGSDWNPGTKTRPWRTPAKAFSAAQAGDTILFGAGTYLIDSKLKPAHNGRLRAPITFAGNPHNHGQAIFKADNADLISLIDLSGCSYTKLKDLELTQRTFGSNYGNSLVRIESDAHHIYLQSLRIHDTGKASAVRITGSGGFGNLGYPNVSDISILGGEISNVGNGVNRESLIISGALRVTIKGIHIHDGYSDLIMLNRINGAVIDDVKLIDPLEGGDQHEDCLHIYWATNVTVKNSIIKSVKGEKTGVMVGSAEGITNSQAENILFNKDVIQANKESGALDISGATGIKIVACTVAARKHPVAISNPDSLVSQTDVSLANNRFFGSKQWMYSPGGTIRVSSSHNACYPSTMP